MVRRFQTARKSVQTTVLRAWAYLTAGLLGVIGFAGCCQDMPLKYGVVPLYGPVQLEYGPPAIESNEGELPAEPAALPDSSVPRDA